MPLETERKVFGEKSKKARPSAEAKDPCINLRSRGYLPKTEQMRWGQGHLPKTERNSGRRLLPKTWQRLSEKSSRERCNLFAQICNEFGQTYVEMNSEIIRMLLCGTDRLVESLS